MASVEPNTYDNYIIQPINKETVHRICSGQVVLSLAIAVKELVENGIDAGATIIDIHLREYGSELIEVSDNGSGVCKDNFQALTLKHFTSKLKDFNDLEHISTLGFRGEALSSLCALCDLTITTKHKNDDIATKLCYDRNGKITSQCAAARGQGTKVTIQDLFSPLPVRRKEFLKNLKREFSKMCQLLYAYCLVSKNIKFTCTNVTAKCPKNTVVSTEGHKIVRENIISVFGVKQLASLIEIPLVSPDTEILKEFNLEPEKLSNVPFSFEFMISTVSHGRGRSSTDRQFYFINSRPCEPTKLIRLVNEIYKQFNNKQYPFVYLNIITNSTTVDVNVTPDKRQIFLEKEKILLATLKASLLESFKQFPSTYEVQNLNASKSLVLNNVSTSKYSNKGIKRSLTDSSSLEKTILERFCKSNKRSKSDETCERTLSLNATKSFESDDIVEEILTKTICKLSEENNVIENIADNDDVSEVLEDVEISTDNPNQVHQKISRKTLDVNLNDIKKRLEERNVKNNAEDIKVKFRSEITPDTNKTAEEELQRQIAKVDFRQMDIVGQFNLSFVIVNFDGDLFIVDQHASDEKYNFEQMQLHTVIESQNLVCPKALDLTSASETILIDNENVFKKNGFAFKIDNEAPSTKKVSLLSVPLSQKFVFGKSDIDEMIFMLQDANHGVVVPSRLRAMFASRACRKSIMVGKALSINDMRKLIDHMGEIEQPWNCPHGRPTMRHLINLNLVVDTT